MSSPLGLSPETVSYTNMSLRLSAGLKPINGNRKTPVELEAQLLGGNMAAWRRERGIDLAVGRKNWSGN